MFNILTVSLVILHCILSDVNCVTEQATLRFKLGGRHFPDTDPLGTLDPYVIIKVTENEEIVENEIAKSDTLNNSENPDWPNIFTFQFDRPKKQKWHFIVYDHDASYFDDKAGNVWVNVSDYVDHNQYLQAKLNKKGYLIIQKA